MQNLYIYNCHTHIFNLSSAPERFMYLFKSKFLSSLLTPVLKTKWGGKLLSGVLGPFDKKAASFIRIGTEKTQDMIFLELAGNYEPGSRFVVLTINFEFMGAGTSKINYETQLQQVIEVKKLHPDTCLPFLSIDPRMGTGNYIRQFTEQYIKQGFVGIKLYPSLGYYPFDPRLQEVYRYADENQIPIMTHCTKQGIYFYEPQPLPKSMAHAESFNPPPPELFGNVSWSSTVQNSEFCDNFLDPRNYINVLNKYPNLKICLAHYGGETEITKNIPIPQNEEAHNWYRIIRDEILLAKDNNGNLKYKNVYADVSYSLFNSSIHPLIKEDLQNPDLRGRILFGTDFFMTEQENPERKLYTDLINDLGSTDFYQIANTNAVAYLTSKFYKAPVK